MRITAACPEALVADANQLAMCLGASVADGATYTLPCAWQDAQGNLYSAASWEASDDWIITAQQPVQRPSWDVDEVIDMSAAMRAQMAIMFTTDVAEADPQRITVIGGMSGIDAVNQMGLTAVISESDPELHG